MRAQALAWLGLLVAPLLLLATPTPSRAETFEDALLAEINKLRADPPAYARELRRQQMIGVRYHAEAYGGLQQEEPQAVEEAISVLSGQRPLAPLGGDVRLDRAAQEHVDEQGPEGSVGHGEPGAFGRRIRAQGLWAGLQAEGISYGQFTPADVVRQLVVDSRVPSRGHRHDLLSPAYQVAGVACGPHARWGAMCVIEYAGAVQR